MAFDILQKKKNEIISTLSKKKKTLIVKICVCVMCALHYKTGEQLIRGEKGGGEGDFSMRTRTYTLIYEKKEKVCVTVEKFIHSFFINYYSSVI